MHYDVYFIVIFPPRFKNEHRNVHWNHQRVKQGKADRDKLILDKCCTFLVSDEKVDTIVLD